MKARELDAAFDADASDIVDQLDIASGRRPRRNVQRVNVDFPAWMVSSLDAEASRLGITRQAVIKTWIAERLDRHAG
ncbi:MAG: type II toxin-antitoxin system BrnA family antitoxin [Candidatus Nanopelagicales bacterium]